MILQILIRKMILFLAPMVLFYILRKIGKEQPKRKSQPLNIDKNSIVEGEVVKDQK